MSQQEASTILMVRPAAFGFNRQTADSNSFQRWSHLSSETLQRDAEEEFDKMVEVLIAHDITVLMVEDTHDISKPDAIFPNNWLNTSSTGIISIFPLQALNRRPEKRDDILVALTKKFVVNDVVDWSEYEAEGLYLEGTGSMVMDHDNKIIYAGLSPRTHKTLLEQYARYHQYRVIWFTAKDKTDHLIYHTNVMMSIGERVAVLCEKSIVNEFERVVVIQLLSSTKHKIIPISLDQMHHFAGNLLFVKNRKGKSCVVLSQQALDSLTGDQVKQLESFATVITVKIPTIEKVGGGSVRCMIAEVFLPPRK